MVVGSYTKNTTIQVMPVRLKVPALETCRNPRRMPGGKKGAIWGKIMVFGCRSAQRKLDSRYSGIQNQVSTSSFRYSRGDLPVHFLKAFGKEYGSANPSNDATSRLVK
jgi:hypothetical protein